MNVRAYQNVIIYVSSASSGDATLDLWTAIAESDSNPQEPTWATLSTTANRMAPQGFWDYNTGLHTTGTTGFVMAGTDSANARNLLVNVDGIDFINIDVSAYSAGTISADVRAYTHNS